MCVADIPECPERSESEDSSEDIRKIAAAVDDNGEGIGVCQTTRWSEWSECSATCGIGVSMRTRTFINHVGRKKCPHISVVEKEKCMKPECSLLDVEVPDSMCPTTVWSDWSPCSATCGKGVRIRTRLLLVGPDLQEKCSQRLELNQQRPCSEKADCSIDLSTAREICVLPPESGPCRGKYQRFAYDGERDTCVPFFYGGCRGNRNNFLTNEDCLQTCRTTKEYSHSTVGPLRYGQDLVGGLPVDCVLSDWTEWSSCSVTCGTGRSERYRNVVVPAQNGGQPCPNRQVKRRKCSGPPC